MPETIKEVSFESYIIPQAMFRNKKTLMIVDDSKNIQEIAVAFLEDTYDVFVADNGREALDKLSELKKRNINISIIITDINMPVMTGPEFVMKLKENPEFKDTPTIIMTGASHEQSKQRIITNLLARL
jgi:CheY-like chemotaxis protein